MLVVAGSRGSERCHEKGSKQKRKAKQGAKADEKNANNINFIVRYTFFLPPGTRYRLLKNEIQFFIDEKSERIWFFPISRCVHS